MSLKVAIVNLMPDPFVKIFAGPYMAGDSEELAASVATRLWSEKKLKSTVDLLGEELISSEEVEETIISYKKVVDELGPQEFATISLKPTQLGSHESTDVCAENIARLASYAGEQKIPVTIDMEDHPYTDMTLEIYRRLLPRFPDLGTVLQTRLFRTDQDIANLNGLSGRIRLCIGIYLEPRDIALQKKPEMKTCLLEQGERLLDDGHYVEFGTHDEELLGKLVDMTARKGFTSDRFEFQMLLGVPRDTIQQQLIADGHTVRLYLPYAVQWKHALGYSKRRLAANPNMAIYVMRNMVAQLFGKR